MLHCNRRGEVFLHSQAVSADCIQVSLMNALVSKVGGIKALLKPKKCYYVLIENINISNVGWYNCNAMCITSFPPNTNNKASKL